jgi:sugar transferase (PEP-CTERM/EpsH1 system associated)
MNMGAPSIHKSSVGQAGGLSSSGPWISMAAPERVEPLRIMHVVDRLDIGGTEKVMMKLIQDLNPGLFQHRICTLRGAAPQAQSWSAKVTLLDAGSGGSNLQLNVIRLARIMRTVRPTIVHSRNWGGIEAILAARIARVPVVIHSEHGYQLEMQNGLPWRQRIFRRWSYKYATAVFTVTGQLRTYHEAQAGCPSGTIQVIYNGVDDSKFKARPEVRTRIRRELNIPSDRLVIGFVGRLVALKDVMTLLKGVEILGPGSPSAHVLIVGSGPELLRLEEYVRQSSRLLGRVTFTGASDNVAELLNGMDVFVLPSLLEGMSNTLLEAMSSGVPVIATGVGGNPEVVEEGVCGYLFRPAAADELAGAMRKLLHDEHQRVRLGTAARQLVQSKFSLDRMLSRYSEFYLSLAAEQGVTLPKEAYVRN